MAEQIWTRRENETSVAYDAFKAYLYAGKSRGIRTTGDAVGKSESLMKRWAAMHRWHERAVAYDSYIATADTDGLLHQLAESRDKNLALMNKLRDHLSDRLDHFIQTKQDPTIRWTQALAAMARVEQNSLMLRDDSKTDERIGRIEELVERAMEDRPHVRKDRR